VTTRSTVNGFIVATGALALIACSPGGKTEDPAASTEGAAATATAEPAPAGAAAVAKPLFEGVAGVDGVPASLLPQMVAETAPHWARCGDEMVAEVLGADGKSEGFIVARGVSFTSVDAAIDVPSQKQGVTSRRGINLRSTSYVQYFGEGVSRSDISGRNVVKAGWGDELRMTAPLPHWRADEANGTWQAVFRPNTTDSDQWKQRYRAADCAAVPPKA
jgi:hypothetical protein